MTPREHEGELIRTGGESDVLDPRERWQLQQRWREVYAVKLHAATSKWKLGEYEWEVFSCEYARAVNGERAVVAYLDQQANTVVVCPEEACFPAVRLTGGALPAFFNRFADVHVWPEGLG